MYRIYSRCLLPLLLALGVLLGACGTKDDGFTVQREEEDRMEATSDGIEYKEGHSGYVAARELRLKARELGEQLVANIQDCSLQGTVALPVSFVNLNDFNETSSFGRLMAEQMFFELNQRGYPVREYRTNGSIQPSPRAGEFTLSRELGRVNARAGNSVIVLGTYSQTDGAVFVNARLVRPRDGRVLRTASIVLDANDTVVALLGDKAHNRFPITSSGGSRSRGGKNCGSGYGLGIRDYRQVTSPPAPPRTLTPFDYGQDVHGGGY
ncbi:hypothetical protein LJC46_03605 [Desulfovibrio sp. OttesenSCG-928-G15]|nr:hypothetical protein [Desulfovibrio sp. OttesenSCG-928-G15]